MHWTSTACLAPRATPRLWWTDAARRQPPALCRAGKSLGGSAFFPAQAALVQAAGLGTRQIGRQHRVNVEVGKSLLRQQNAAAGALLHPQQNFAVAAQLGFVQQVAGGGQAVKLLLGQVCQPRKRRAAVAHPQQSTRAGAWLSERGRPYLSSASRYGSGSNSSTVCTPLVVHLPVSSIRAPHMAGTPVV